MFLAPLRAGISVGEPTRPLPRWDADSRRLWLGSQLIKQFGHEAPSQAALLQAFEEDGWEGRFIDDPLPRDLAEDDADAKRRLAWTVQNLNRLLPRGTLRFHGDGTGQGVRWDYDPGKRRKRRRKKRR